MSNARYDYDENAETWPYFVLSTLAVPLVPATLSLAYNLCKPVSSPAITRWFKPYNHAQLRKFHTHSQQHPLLNYKTAFISLGWIIIALLVHHVRSIKLEISDTNFDPWKILDISESASEKIIKSAYRKLSLKFHPDKINTSQMTQEEIDLVDSTYVLINKAYKALTDESVRENFLKYGNPDGPAEIKHGIALPKSFIDGPTSPLLVIFYILLIAVVLPLIVNNWWSGVKSKTKRDVHVNTAHHFLKLLINASPTHLLTVDDILKHVSSCVEYSTIQSSLTTEKVYNLLKSYIDRTPASNDKEEQLRLKVVAITPKLLLAYIDVAAAFKNTDYCLKIVETHRCIIQALNIESSAIHYQYRQLLQLPATNVQEIDPTVPTFTLGKLLKEKEQKVMPLTNDKILSHASQIPIIEPLECKFVVPGEDIIPPSSTAHISLKFIIKSPSQKGKPSIKSFPQSIIDTQFKEEPTMENLKDPFKFVNDNQLPLSEQLKFEPAPYFPDFQYSLENSGWIVFLIAQRDNKIVEIPQFLNKAHYSTNINLNQDDFQSTKCEISTFKFPLMGPTPKDIGEYQFRLVFRNLIHFGSDLDLPLVMKVENIPLEKENDVAAVYGIEDPDEDSIAGALAQMRGDAVKKVNFENEYESSEDEEEDDDEETDWTDLDTDTELEEDAK